jgi:hypothetical protein
MTRQFQTGINATGASVSGSVLATQAWVQSQGYGSGSAGGGIPTNIAASTGTIASFTISPSALQFYDSNNFFYSGIKSYDEISSSIGQGVFLYAGASDPNDLYNNTPATIIISNGVLFSSSAQFNSPNLDSAILNNSIFYGQVNDVNYGLGDPATKDWVTYGATVYNANNLGNISAASYAKLTSANFTAASVGGSAVATQAYVTSQGYAQLSASNTFTQNLNVTAGSVVSYLSAYQTGGTGYQIRIATESDGTYVEYGSTASPIFYGRAGAFGSAITVEGGSRPVRLKTTVGTSVVAQILAQSDQSSDTLQIGTGLTGASLTNIYSGFNASGQFYTGSSAGLANTQVYITHSASTITPLVIKGGAYANATLFNIQNYLGTSQFSVNTSGLMQTGNITVNTITNNNSTAPYLGFGSTNSTTATMYARTATNVGFIVQGAASATADLQQWQNSSAASVSLISSSGAFKSSAVGHSLGLIGGGNVWGNYIPVLELRIGNYTGLNMFASSAGAFARLWDNAGNPRGHWAADGSLHIGQNPLGTNQINLPKMGTLSVYNIDSSSVAMAIRSASPTQTADLTQWLDPSGSVLAKINASGKITVVIDGGSA